MEAHRCREYGFVGVLETVASFAMSYWYLQRNGIPFTTLWFMFGSLPADIDPEYYIQKTNEASSIYFVTLVVIECRRNLRHVVVSAADLCPGNGSTLLSVRTKRLSIFQHPPVFNKLAQNYYLFPAVLFSLVMAFFWLYIPPLQTVLAITQVPVEHWFLPMRPLVLAFCCWMRGGNLSSASGREVFWQRRHGD